MHRPAGYTTAMASDLVFIVHLAEGCRSVFAVNFDCGQALGIVPHIASTTDSLEQGPHGKRRHRLLDLEADRVLGTLFLVRYVRDNANAHLVLDIYINSSPPGE